MADHAWKKQPSFRAKLLSRYENYFDSYRLYSDSAQALQESVLNGLGGFAKTGTVSDLYPTNSLVGVRGDGSTGLYLRTVSVASQPLWIGVQFVANSVSSAQKACYTIGSSSASAGAFIGISSGNGVDSNIAFQFRGTDGGNLITKYGPLPEVGNVYTAIAVFPSTSTADAYMYVNGKKYNTSAISDNNIAFATTLVNEAVLALKRATSAAFSGDTILWTARGTGLIPEHLARQLSINPYYVLTPLRRKLFIPSVTVAVTHATTGALTGQGASIVGSAAHIATHTTSGTLTGQGAVVDGSAARTRVHTNTGVLTGQGAVIDGTAAHIAIHATSGVLTGQGAVIDGSADHVAAGGTHTTSGALTGQGSVVDGSAAHIPNHQTSGTLTGQGSEVAGTAVHNVPHGTSGDLVGQGSTVEGSAVHILNHQTSGTLTGQGAVIDGSAARVAGAVSHDTSGDLVGIGSELSGSAQNGIIVADTTQNSGGFVDFGSLRERRRFRKQEEKTKLKPVEVKKPIITESKPKLTPVISDLLDKSAKDYVKSNVIPLKSNNESVKKSLAKQKRIEREKQLLKDREAVEQRLKEQEEKELEAVKMIIAEYQLELQEQEDELILQFMLEL